MAILTASSPTDPSQEGTKDYAPVMAILAFLFFFAPLLALFFAALFFPSWPYARTEFCCNNPLHVRVQGVGVWSRSGAQDVRAMRDEAQTDRTCASFCQKMTQARARKRRQGTRVVFPRNVSSSARDIESERACFRRESKHRAVS